MMKNRWKALRGSAGFYGTLAVCLLAAGVVGWALLMSGGGTETAQGTVDTAAVETVTVPEAPAAEASASADLAPEEPVEPEAAASVTVMPEEEIDDTPVAAVEPRLVVSPLNGNVLTAFSVDQLVYDPTMEDWRVHDGVDISAKPGTTVQAACAGTVLSVEEDAFLGTTVVIGHDGGYQTTYANLQAQPTVQAGDSVSAGAVIGAVGATAAAESAQSPHLHFAVSRDGDVMDPEAFLDR
jgi:murein DD-endopeptidase MepM/ murein hydrolase activator NlpD